MLLVLSLCILGTDQCCGSGDGSGVCDQATFMHKTTTCCAGDVESNVCGSWSPTCDKTTGGGCCCDESAMTDPMKDFCASACNKAAGCTGGVKKGCAPPPPPTPPTPPPTPLPTQPQAPTPKPTPPNTKHCPKGVWMNMVETCCMSGIDAAVTGDCSTWHFTCDHTTGSGCCCDRNAMSSQPYCSYACSLVMGCYNLESGPYAGTGCSYAWAKYACGADGKCAVDKSGKQSLEECSSSCKAAKLYSCDAATGVCAPSPSGTQSGANCTTTCTAPTPTVPTPSPTPAATTSAPTPAPPKLSTAGLAGVVLGASAVLCACIAFFIRRRRASRVKLAGALLPAKDDADDRALSLAKDNVMRSAMHRFNVAKLMFIGQERAGKTSLLRNLSQQEFDDAQQTTDGADL